MSYLEISLNSSNIKFYTSSDASEITPSEGNANAMFDEFGGTVTTIGTEDAEDFYLIYTFDYPQYLAKIEFDFLTVDSSPTNRIFAVSDGTPGSTYNVVQSNLGTGTVTGNKMFNLTHNPYGGLVKSFKLHLQDPGSDNVIKIRDLKAYALEDLTGFKQKSFLKINDSEFEREGWKNARYKGSKLKTAKINEFSEGDISFANQPVIEQYSKTVYVFSQMNESFESLAGIFYPATDEFGQTLPDKRVIGSTQFVIDRAVTFNIDDPSNFEQIDPGVNENDYNYYYFDTLIKNDLALFNSCSVRFFDNTNNGFTKPSYTIGHNKGKFQPAAVFFPSASANSDFHNNEGGNTRIRAEITNNGRLYINPNIEEWFIAQTGASGSQGSLTSTADQTEAITITHTGNGNGSNINSTSGYILGLSKQINKNNPYFIVFNQGLQGIGTQNEKNLLKAFDVRELQHSGSNIHDFAETSILKIKTEGKDNGSFTTTYNTANEQDAIIFKRYNTNNVVHLNFNKTLEAPAGTGNGGVIIPNNLHPIIKESLNVYLSNAGLGAEGGSSANFNLGSVSAIRNRVLDDTITLDDIPTEAFESDTKVLADQTTTTPWVEDTSAPGYGEPDPGNPHTPDDDPNPPDQTPQINPDQNTVV